MKILSRKFALSALVAVHMNLRSVYSVNITLPLNPYWRVFLADNRQYLEAISSNLGYIAENQESRCPIHLGDDPRLPQTGPKSGSLGDILGTLYRAIKSLHQLVNVASEKLQQEPENPNTLNSLRSLGFDSVDAITNIANKLDTYLRIYVISGKNLARFLLWLGKPTRIGTENDLLKYIYNAKLTTIRPGTIPGINMNTPGIEINPDAKDAFIARLAKAAQMIDDAAYKVTDEAADWAASLRLPTRTHHMLIPENAWVRNIATLLEEAGGYFYCWKTPVDNLLRNTLKLKPPPEFQLGLELQSRPEGNPMTGEPEGWEWEEGTNEFPGLLNQGGRARSVASTMSETSRVSEPEEGANPSDYLVGYVFHNPDIDAHNRMVEDEGEEAAEEEIGAPPLGAQLEQLGSTPPIAIEEEQVDLDFEGQQERLSFEEEREEQSPQEEWEERGFEEEVEDQQGGQGVEEERMGEEEEESQSSPNRLSGGGSPLIGGVGGASQYQYESSDSGWGSQD
ncbi:hypothetical protein TWF718_001223 [Orbilia javanica]|uniref:Uncharacterized protein n=1 Tax=Orbilia javanica TaxID=47235 RepID=A0AAN8N0Z5_9PEZI